MKHDLLALLDASDSIIDLEERLKETAGLEFSNHKQYLSWLTTEWNKISAPAIQKILETEPSEKRFPDLTVKSQDTEYHLHGIFHGNHKLFTPGLHPRKNIKQYVSSTANNFRSRGSKEDFLYEQNMHSVYSLIEYNELKDHAAGIKKENKPTVPVLSTLGNLVLFVPAMLGLFAVLPILSGVTYAYAKNIKKPKNDYQENAYLILKALTDEKYQAHFADFYFTKEMPQPFNLEKVYLREKNSKIEKFFNFVIGKADGCKIATSAERSLWTANELRKYAVKNKIKKMHYLGGVGHTTEIAYFIKNPDFSFERLEEYRLSGK